MLIRDIEVGGTYAVDDVGDPHMWPDFPPATLDNFFKVQVRALVSPSDRADVPCVVGTHGVRSRHVEVHVLALPVRRVSHSEVLRQAAVGERILLPATFVLAEWDAVVAAQAAHAAVLRHRATLQVTLEETVKAVTDGLSAQGIATLTHDVYPARAPDDTSQVALTVALLPAQIPLLLKLLGKDRVRVTGTMQMAAPDHRHSLHQPS